MKSLFTRHLTKLEGCSTGNRLYRFKLITDSAQIKHYEQQLKPLLADVLLVRTTSFLRANINLAFATADAGKS